MLIFFCILFNTIEVAPSLILATTGGLRTPDDLYVSHIVKCPWAIPVFGYLAKAFLVFLVVFKL